MADYLMLLLGMGLVTYLPRWFPLHYLSRRSPGMVYPVAGTDTGSHSQRAAAAGLNPGRGSQTSRPPAA